MKSITHISRSKICGFTLVEMIVSIGIFTIVMLIATSAIFTVISANKKAQSLKLVMDNLDFALQSMVREIRVGNTYTCPDSCASGPDTQFQFQSSDPVTPASFITYQLSGSQIVEYDTAWTNNATPIPITASTINITSLKFYLFTGTKIQPRVLITLSGTAGAPPNVSTFNIQTTVSERGFGASGSGS